MAKRESTFFNMVLALLTITLVASASLGFIYELTKEPIEAARAARKNNAIRAVVPDFDNSPTEEQYTIAAAGGELVFYPAKKDGELVGTAIETFTNRGFSGTIKLMVGLLPDGTIHGIEVLEHKETPGLGDKMESDKSDFSAQFEGQKPEDFRLRLRQDGGDVDGITATTISSRAYCEAVQLAYDLYIDKDADVSYELPAREDAVERVLEDFTNNPLQEEYRVVVNGNEYTVFPGRRGRRYTGLAVDILSEAGYIGPIRLMVGFDSEGVITGIEVLGHEETPGYGDLIENARSDFYKQFIGLNPGEDNVRLKEEGGIIDGISGATVTANAYCEAVRSAWDIFRKAGN
ncbi:MAG: RnfABCDGE type electron transport complex subunit G [Marinilabiliales bacterium]|nr:MAG: RnfABCDGE type electron transport complex subunit G [Marinilabiliales bacterium]